MRRTRLELINEQGLSDIVNSNVPVLTDIPVGFVLQIADVREPENGVGTRSYTIDIPSTPEIDDFFDDVYSLNVSLSTYNPKLKIRAVYYVDDLPTIEGNLQLLQIDLDETKRYKVYKCNILGDVLNLFNTIKGRYLTDLYNYPTLPSTTYLALSVYNHTLNASTISNSWAAGPGVSYVYPLIDRGHVQSYYNGASGFSIDQYAGCGCIYAKAYLDRIFEQAGFTYTSTFFNSNTFKRLILTPTKVPTLSAAILAQNKFLANRSTSLVLPNKTMTNPATSLFAYNQGTPETVVFNNEVYDTGNKYNNTTGVWSPTITKQYNVQGNVTVDIQFFTASNVDVTSNTVAVSGNITFGVTSVGNTTPALTSLTLGSGGANAFSVQVNNWLISAPTTINCYFTFNNLLVQNPIDTISYMRVTVTAGNFSAEFSSAAPYSGQAIDALDMIPEDYAQDEFIRDLRKMFNLYFVVDKDNPRNLIVEPRPDFYLNTALDWTYKHDASATTEIYPVGELNVKKYLFTYSEDSDYFNTNYLDNFKESYGSEDVEVESDFITPEKEIKVTFAPTHLVGNNYNNGLVLPTYRKQDLYNISEHKPKPRILYWGGLISASNNAQPISFAFNNTITNTYPFAGHVDNPFNPQVDIGFGLPRYVYFIKPNQTWTTNNLYNKYYSQYINQITDKDSKIVKTRFLLTPEDIHSFDFRSPIFCVINGEQGYYLVNKIEYDPMTFESSEVELLKLTDYDVFTATIVEFNNGLNFSNTGHERQLNQSFVSGENNFSNAPDSVIIGGANNFLNEQTESVMLIGSNDVQPTEELSNFLGIGLSSSSEIESNSVNFFDNFRVLGGADGGVTALRPRVLRVTSDFSIDGDYQIYEIDLDSIGTNITCYWDAATYPVEVTFKIVSNSMGLDFIIDDGASPPMSPPLTLDDQPLPAITGLVYNDSITVYSNGTQLKIV